MNYDMIGHIAYSLYKSNKINFIEQFKADNDNIQPSEADLHVFHQASRPNIPALRAQAEQILSNFTKLTLEEAIQEIEIKIQDDQEKTLRQIIEPIVPKTKGHWDGFWMSVLVKGAQTVVLALVFFLIIFFASAKDDFWGTIRQLIPESHKVLSDKQLDTTSTNH